MAVFSYFYVICLFTAVLYNCAYCDWDHVSVDMETLGEYSIHKLMICSFFLRFGACILWEELWQNRRWLWFPDVWFCERIWPARFPLVMYLRVECFSSSVWPGLQTRRVCRPQQMQVLPRIHRKDMQSRFVPVLL